MNIVDYQRESVQLYLMDSEYAQTFCAPGEPGTLLLRVTHLHATWVRRGRACQLQVNMAGRRIEAAGVLGDGMQLWCQESELPGWVRDLLASATPPWWPR